MRHHTRGAEIFSTYIKSRELKDIWLTNKDKNVEGFTWSNADNSISSRIDRIYMHEKLTEKIKKIKTEQIYITDHKAIIVKLELEEKINFGKTYWKMNTSVLNNKEYRNRIKGFWSCWRKNKNSLKLDQWWDIGKKQIQDITINYCKKMSLKMKKQKKDLNDKLCQELKTKNYKKYKELETKLQLLNEQDSFGTQIRSGQKIVEELEIPNDYFYRIEKNRKAKKQIYEMEVNGNLTKKQSEIGNHIREYYKVLYTDTKIDEKLAQEIIEKTNKKCSEQHKENLAQKITKEELLHALNNTEKNKSPGIDGIPYEFYKEFWEEIGEDLTEIINLCFEKGQLTKTQRKAVITMIPKKSDTTKVENLRPISLLNCDLKIATKALAYRLEEILPKIIKPTQTCSIKGRKMHHHTLLVREIISCAKTTGKPTYILTFDQEKAFDKVSWKYLEMVLEKFDFPKEFIKMIKTTYNNIQSTILINGNLTKPFSIRRGLRQGCPLSLILYILIAETLGNFIQDSKQIEGYNLPLSKSKVKQIQFADDTTIVLNRIQQIKTIMNILEKYCKATGAKINHKKTKGIHLNHPKEVKIEDIYKIEWNKNDTKILGIIFTPDPLVNQKLNWEKIRKEIKSRACLLSARSLSLKGKAQIVNTMLLSKAWTVGRVYPPTNDVIRKINKIIFGYIWNKKHEPIARESLFQPLQKGGIGLLSLEIQCAAMQTLDIAEVGTPDPPQWTTGAEFWLSPILKTLYKEWAHIKVAHHFEKIPSHYEFIKPYIKKVYPKILKESLTTKKIRKCIMEGNKRKK